MTPDSIFWWIVVGLIAGWLASRVVGGPYGLIGDILVGIIGAFIGSQVFHALHLTVPFHGIAGIITVAFVGALIFLIVLRLLHQVIGRRR